MNPPLSGRSDMDLSPRHSSTTKSFNGCWTCRLRRKKCDEKHPICQTCAGLHITCYFDQNKPEWMDGGVRQEEMAARLKREVKEKAHLRREERAVHLSADQVSVAGSSSTDEMESLSQNLARCLPTPICSPHNTTGAQRNSVDPYTKALSTSSQRGTDCMALSKDARDSMTFGGSDTILLMFYLEHVLPFLFPFYRPSILEGGRAWTMELMMKSPVMRQTAFCQSSYYFSIARGATDGDMHWEALMVQTRDAFEMLRQALQVIDGAGITEHLHGAVRILASIIQVQRFEIAVLSFDNCHAHLNAALALFKQLLESVDVAQPACPSLCFDAVVSRLGPSSWIPPAQNVQTPSPEAAAFRFSSALLILDDIVASTMLQEQPKLYAYHPSFLGNLNDTEPPINLEAVLGCQNWVLLEIGEIAALDAWKQQYKRAGMLDMMELVRRATNIKNSIEAQLTRLETGPTHVSNESSSLLDIFTRDYGQQATLLACQRTLVTRVWAHGALLYLSVVVSGWQPASVDVQYHVIRIVELLTHSSMPPTLLHTMIWPFCVAGCLAEPTLEAHFRGMVEALQPPSVFGTVRKALEIMENAWRDRGAGDPASRDLATYFRSQGHLVLLV